MDFTQIVLALTIVIITALLTVLGIEVFYILKDVRKLLDRVGIMMNDAEEIVGHVKKPSQMIASISQSAELVSRVIEAIKPQQQPKQEQVVRTVIVEESQDMPVRESIRSTPVSEPQMPVPQALGRRFFRMPRRPVS